MVNNTMDAPEWLRKQLDGDENDLLREMMRELAQRLMAAEVDALAGAGWGEVSSKRVNHRNGYRQRPLDTRVGSIDLAIPKPQKGSYFADCNTEPGCLEARTPAPLLPSQQAPGLEHRSARRRRRLGHRLERHPQKNTDLRATVRGSRPSMKW